MNIQQIIQHPIEYADTLSVAIEKCNHNFKILSSEKELMLIPMSCLDETLLKFIEIVKNVFIQNSKILGYKYEDTDFLGMLNGQAIEALFKPIAIYFNDLATK